MKLPARRVGLPSKVLSLIWCSLIRPTCLPQERLGLRDTFRPKGIGWLSWKQLKDILAIPSSHWTREGLPCGVAKLTPQGKGGVIEF
jgi:hypothetical protein